MSVKLNDVAKLLPKADNKAVLLSDWQNTNDLIKAIAQAHQANLKYARKIAHLFKGYNDAETCKNVFNFLRYEVPYKVESSERQKIKTLPRFLQDSKSINGREPVGNDCKMYSVFTNTILNSLGIPAEYRFTSYKGTQPTHVYSVYKKGNLIIDAVLPNFDTEKPYKSKKDMALYKMSGIDEESESRKFIDMSSPDAAINGNITKLVKKSKESINKAVKAAPAVAKKIVQTAKTTSLAVPRNAFLALVALNVKGFASKLMELVKRGDDLKWWVQLGGDRTKLKNTAEAGAKRKKIGGFEEDINTPETLVIAGITDNGMIGVEPTSTAAAAASAVPIIVKFLDVLKKSGIKADDVKQVADMAKQGSQTFEQLTGKKISEVVFTKDAGKDSKKISLRPADLLTPSRDVAEKVAKAVIKNATGVTEEEFTQATEQPGGGSSQKSADAPAPDKPGTKDKPTDDKSFIEKNKFTLIGVGIGLGVLYFATRKKRR